MLARFRRRQKGFTLIELLIVVAIIGIIAAILIPNFLDALHKGRQKRTMGDIKQFGTGIGAYWTDFGGAAAAGATVTVASWLGAASTDELQNALVPEYIPQLPINDAWGNTMEYHIQLSDPPRIFYALVRAQCRGGAFEGAAYTAGSFSPTDYDQDIVWADGGFVRAPAGSLQSTP
jgi:prepilin-type N-terminal cleavage/methylation domain-containing protein